MGAQVFDLPVSNSATHTPVWGSRPPIVTVSNPGEDQPDSSTMITNHDVTTHSSSVSPIQEFQTYIEQHPSEHTSYSSFLDPHHKDQNGSVMTGRLSHEQPPPIRDHTIETSLVITSPEHEEFDRLEGYGSSQMMRSHDPRLYEISVGDGVEFYKENLGEATHGVAATTHTINATPEPLIPPNSNAV